MPKIWNGDCAINASETEKTKPPNDARCESQTNTTCSEPARDNFWNIRSILPFIADHFICGLLVGPLTVFCWRGAWNLLDRYLFPGDLRASGFICAGVGNVGLLVIVFSQSFLKRRLNVDNRVHWWIGYHAFTVICFMFNVCHWRGIWKIIDYYTGINEFSAWSNVIVGLIFLIYFRCFKNAQAPPMSVAMDTDKDFFTYTTRFRTKASISENHILDVTFTVIVVHQLVVCYWRGVWNVLDQYLLPGQTSLKESGLASVAISFCIMTIVAIAQPLMNAVYRRLKSRIGRWLLEVGFFMVSNLINVTQWRGVWMLCDNVLLPDSPSISCAITLSVGMILICFMLTGNSLTVRGCEIDGESDDANGCMCPNRYLRYFLDQRKRRTETTANKSEPNHNLGGVKE